MLHERLASAIEGLFDSSLDSDCTILFCRDGSASSGNLEHELPVETSDDGRSSEPHGDLLGAPLPAHKFVLRHMSERFRAQLERWQSDQDQSSCNPSAAPAPADPQAPQPPAGRHAPLVLRVPLSSEAEVPAARAACQFAYTGRLRASNIREALEVRRQAVYLRIEGCAAACDNYIIRRIDWGGAESLGGRSGLYSFDQSEMPGSAGNVLELYACTDVWPAAGEEGSSFDRVRATAAVLLVAHFRDALATLNTSPLREQLLTLPVEALTVLLESDNFGTDSESTVLLLLAEWMTVNYARTDAATRHRLCRLVRLVQLSRAYLTAVLPALALDHETRPDEQVGWFAVTVMEAAFIGQYAVASAADREDMGYSAAWDLTSPTYSFKRRAQTLPPGGLSFVWSIDQAGLPKDLAALKPNESKHADATFNTPESSCIFWQGFATGLFLCFTGGQTANAGVFLWCNLPGAFALPSSKLAAMRNATSAFIRMDGVLLVHRSSSSGGPLRLALENAPCDVGRSYGWTEGVPLKPQLKAGGDGDGDGGSGDSSSRAVVSDSIGPKSGGGCSAVAALAEYMRDGKITGSLTLMRPKTGGNGGNCRK